MIREDRELLAELAQLNGDVAPLAMRIMDGSATCQEQHEFATRLTTAGQRLHRRADEMQRVVIEGEVLVANSAAVGSHSAGAARHQEP